MKSFVDFYNSTAIISHAICNIKFMESKVMLATSRIIDSKNEREREMVRDNG